MFLHRMSRESVVQARDLLQRAIELDPNFASAYAELGLFTITGLMWGDGVPEPHPDRRIRELVERALALDDSLAIGHIVMAFLRPEREKALAEADRAMALGPNNASIIAFAAGIYADWGKPREAITLLEKAMRRNPRYPGWYLSTLARAYALTDRYEEAIAAHKKVLVSHPDFLPSHVELASIYRRLGRSEEARTEEAEVHRINPAILPDVEEIVESGPPTS
jgi:tetratricopeptide (TPR) repeat protein